MFIFKLFACGLNHVRGWRGRNQHVVSICFRKTCARLHDDLFLYTDMTESDDLDKVTEEYKCKFFNYEKLRARHLKLKIEKMLKFLGETEMSEQNRSLFDCRVIPIINDVRKAVDDLLSVNGAGSTETDSRVESILNVSTACKKGLDILDDLCLQPVKPRWADLTDAGPGVGVPKLWSPISWCRVGTDSQFGLQSKMPSIKRR